MFLEDDTKLKIMFLVLVVMFAVISIGVWEVLLEPLFIFLKNSIVS
ncbi:MAG: hypothetical protein WC610_03260 [Patescibacteria group bacterium]